MQRVRAPPRLRRAHALPHSDAQQHQRRAGSSACRASATRSAPSSTARTPSWCAPPTCTAMTIPARVRAVGRAGAGVNNIPVAALSERGIPVFNAPGANANAVKELVLAGLLLAARNICPAWAFARALERRRRGDRGGGRGGQEAASSASSCRAARSGVVGLGAIGVEVANCRARPRHEGARLRPADHRAARLAAVRERRAGAVARRPVRARRCDHACTCRSTSTPAAWSTRRASSSCARAASS